MNYQHIYHAGNFADVFKHITLIAMLKILLQKDKPFSYIETHAGRGHYNLRSAPSQKTKEYVSGIGRLFNDAKNIPTLVADYLSIVKKMNPENRLNFYPGSPLIAHALTRADDRLLLMELNSKEVGLLKQEFGKNKKVAIHHIDGYQGLNAFLPPTPRRGLLLIDPPYENKNEYSMIVKNLKIAKERFATGVIAVWYPIKQRSDITRFHHTLKNSSFEKILITELSTFPEDSPMRLNGSGMAIINPPWQLDNHLKKVMPWLWERLSPEKKGGFNVKWLKKS